MGDEPYAALPLLLFLLPFIHSLIHSFIRLSFTPFYSIVIAVETGRVEEGSRLRGSSSHCLSSVCRWVIVCVCVCVCVSVCDWSKRRNSNFSRALTSTTNQIN